MNKVAQLLLVLVLLVGCSSPTSSQHTTPSPQVRVVQLPILDVVMPDSVALGDTLIFSARVFAPTPCWHHDHFAFEQRGDTRNVTAFGRQEPGLCVQVTASYWASSWSIPTKLGEVTFHFIGQDSVLARTVTVYP